MRRHVLGRGGGRDARVDAFGSIACTVCALAAFDRSFVGSGVYTAGTVAAMIGVGTAWIARGRGWTSGRVIVVSCAVMLVAVAPLAGVGSGWRRIVPSVGSLGDAGHLLVRGWKELVTAPGPVSGSSTLLVLPAAGAFVAAAAGWWFADSDRWRHLAALPSLVLLALGIFCGPSSRGSVVSGVALVVMVMFWTHDHVRRPARVDDISESEPWRSRSWSLVSVAAVGAATAALVGASVSAEPMVWRDAVEPPFDATTFPTPLGYYRLFVKTLQDEVLFEVSGVDPGTPIRIVALDQYDGTVWSFGNDTARRAVDGFLPIGADMPIDGTGASSRRITASFPVGSPYREVWLPTVGEVRSFLDGDDDGTAPLDPRTLRYDRQADTAAVIGGVPVGTTYAFEAIIPADIDDLAGDVALAGDPVPLDVVVHDSLRRLAASDTSPNSLEGIDVAEVRAIRDRVRRDGFYSDASDGHVKVPAGHGLARLVAFADASRLVGNSEQYAAAMAIAIRERGARVRVAMGFVVGDDGGLSGPLAVRGVHAEAWVEVAVPGHGWIAVFVTPPRVRTEVVIDGLPVPQPAEQRQIPPDPPPIVVDAQLAPVVQAPSGAPPPTTPASPTVDGPVATPPRSPLLWIPLAFVALMAMLYVGAIGLILGVKRLRTRRRRREPDPADRIANGWDELVDLARDAGRTVPIDLTRAEMATQIGLPGAAHLAAAADTLVFARERPSDHEADRYWNDVELAREHLLVQLDRRARHRVRLNMTSLRH